MSDRPTRDRYHHGDLKRALVEEAFAMVRSAGHAKFSLRAAARAVGVDAAAAYRHFANKDALLAAVASSAFAELARRMETGMAESDDPVERFVATGRAYVQFAIDEPALFRTAFGPRAAERIKTEGVGAQGRNPYELLLDSLSDIRDRLGVDLEPETAALPAWAAMHGLAHLIVDGNLASDPKDVTDGVVHTILRGLGVHRASE
ncbi:MAG: TetR-like C-terminal domain-containing protein [Myxococcota bacterium]